MRLFVYLASKKLGQICFDHFNQTIDQLIGLFLSNVQGRQQTYHIACSYVDNGFIFITRNIHQLATRFWQFNTDHQTKTTNCDILITKLAAELLNDISTFFSCIRHDIFFLHNIEDGIYNA